VADVYVSLSDHEGFGVPLLEAMARGVPVVAYSCTAVPETAGEGALLLDDKRPTVVAAAVHRVVTDADVRRSLVHAGRSRVTALGPAASSARLRTAVEEIVRSP
jgi:glycosyltransferase involved in cell wall biosynthesis